MKQEIKIGDWIKQSHWDKFYEVLQFSGNEIQLKTSSLNKKYWHSKRENWIIKEKEQQLKIEMNKKYRRVGTREPVRVICVDAKCPTPVLMLVGEKEEWVAGTNEQGFCYGIKFIEEVPAVDWSKVEVDTLIWIDGCPRYFSSYVDGKVHYFRDGTTSKTNINGSATISEEVCSLEEPK